MIRKIREYFLTEVNNSVSAAAAATVAAAM